jgi:hypothetical protein
MRWAGQVEGITETKTLCKILVGKREGKRALVKPSPRRVDNIKMDLKNIEREGMDWIHLAEDRDQWRARVNMVMNLQVAQKLGNFLTN